MLLTRLGIEIHVDNDLLVVKSEAACYLTLFTVISDLHGNFNKAILDHSASSDYTICLGDIDRPNEVGQLCQDFFSVISDNSELILIPGNCDPPHLSSTNPWSQWSIDRTEMRVGAVVMRGFGGALDTLTYIRRVREALDGQHVEDVLNEKREEPRRRALQQLRNLYIHISNNELVTHPESDALILFWKHLRDPYEYTEQEISSFFCTPSLQREIWIVHGPPVSYPTKAANITQIAGVSVGSTGLHEAIKRLQPQVVLSGHIHACASWRVGETLCLSVPAFQNNILLQIELEDEHDVSFWITQLK